jgi:hypothetical protein
VERDAGERNESARKSAESRMEGDGRLNRPCGGIGAFHDLR